VQVTLSLESWALVEEIAELTMTPKASILAEVFDVVLPSFASTMAALRLAKEQPREALRLVQNFASKSVMDVQQQNLELNAELSAQEAKKRKRRRVRIAST
jgi:1-aminocyclopropane-1-carboxylate deaminase/D-cysteine desulfhydrase-like pyridoxal-dependent ACC family enzyme